MTAPVSPQKLIELSTAYWGAQALNTAVRLGVFEVLSQQPCGAEAVASKVGAADPRAMELLLNALAALALVDRRDDGTYRNAVDAEAFLVPGHPGYLGDALQYNAMLYDVFGRLEQSVRCGGPAIPPANYLGDDIERTRTFVRGMHSKAAGMAQALPALLDLKGARSVLDIGGGPGTHSAALCAANPELTATVLDLGPITQIGREIMATTRGGDRVRFVDGDYHSIAVPSGFDAVLVAGVLHREKPADAASLLQRAAVATAPGGRVIAVDVFVDADPTEPPFAALFGLMAMLVAENGTVHRTTDVELWLRQAGCVEVATRPGPPGGPHRLVVGRLADGERVA